MKVTRSSTLCLSTGGSTGALLVRSVTAAIPVGVILSSRRLWVPSSRSTREVTKPKLSSFFSSV